MSEAIHDFASKLRQPSLVGRVESYVRWRRALARAADGELPPPPDWAPLSINLDLTTACNYRCDHCIDWEILNSRHRLDERALRRSLSTLAGRGLRSVILIGGGEPTIYPGFADSVRFLKQLRLQVAVVSNGSRGDRLLAVADALDERDWIRLSLDAGSNELFRAMHRPAARSLTLDAICEWVPRLKRRNPRLRIGYSYIIVWRGAARGDAALRENVHEIALAAERARRYGFDYVAFKPVLERGSGGAEIMDPERAAAGLEEAVARIREQLDRARQCAGDGFDVHLSTNWRALESGAWRELARQPTTCHMQAFRQVLGPLGVFNCPAHRGVAKARVADAEGYAGEEAARDTATQLAALMERFDASRECREVTCLYNGANWWLEKMIRDPREDVEIEPGDERLDFFL